ncbi:hypothetical protein PILCRDRAFT_829323 [Piloderma croceum F 1598]|uniref:Uncharacterized protein n=1 Tax=Piloderma croceum (strain F 1598) TaxID=765440 RepID=A0A0C3B7A9_PILCF|nr:hypothetical protein PILCRDRAFT_829323 [Piloderma croceum F 1598]
MSASPASAASSVHPPRPNPSGLVVRTSVSKLPRSTGPRHSPRLHDYEKLNSARSSGLDRTTLRHSRISQMRPDLERTSPNLQCYYCRQGGRIIHCIKCGRAACVSSGPMILCLPESVDESKWECWECTERTGQMSICNPPSIASGGRVTAVDTSALVFLNVYLDDRIERHAVNFLQSIIESRYLGAESHLKIIDVPFTHLGNETRELKVKQQIIQSFARERDCRLVFTIHTHSDPGTGFLQWSPRDMVSFTEIVEHVLGTTALSDFTNSLLFLVTCGGVVDHCLQDIRRWSNNKFRAVIAFKAPNLDASEATCAFLKPVLVYHLFEKHPLISAVQRALSEDFLRHTDIYVATDGRITLLRNAPMRSRPNGLDIYCCGQVPKYQNHGKVANVVRYLCKSPAHIGGRYLKVVLENPHHFVSIPIVTGGRFRYMMKMLEEIV